MLGRFFGGIATSLLFSAFESWLVSEHFKRGYDAQWLSGTFSKAVFLGNGLVAILAGLLANALARSRTAAPARAPAALPLLPARASQAPAPPSAAERVPEPSAPTLWRRLAPPARWRRLMRQPPS